MGINERHDLSDFTITYFNSSSRHCKINYDCDFEISLLRHIANWWLVIASVEMWKSWILWWFWWRFGIEKRWSIEHLFWWTRNRINDFNTESWFYTCLPLFLFYRLFIVLVSLTHTLQFKVTFLFLIYIDFRKPESGLKRSWFGDYFSNSFYSSISLFLCWAL